MRKTFLTVALAGLLCVPVLAQFRIGGMGRGVDGNMLLSSKDVQKELKLSEDQIKAVTGAREEMSKALKAAFEDKDREAMQKASTSYSKALSKVKDGLNAEQKKRLMQIEIQVATKGNQAAIFKNEAVQKGLNLTSKQKDTIKDALSELEKDSKEIMEDAKGDFSKFREAFTKVQGLNKDTFGKITKSLSEEQKKAWKELQGEEFKGEISSGRGGNFGKGKKKKDNF